MNVTAQTRQLIRLVNSDLKTRFPSVYLREMKRLVENPDVERYVRTQADLLYRSKLQLLLASDRHQTPVRPRR